MWLYLEIGPLERRLSSNVRPSGWPLSQFDWCPYKKRKSGQSWGKQRWRWMSPKSSLFLQKEVIKFFKVRLPTCVTTSPPATLAAGGQIWGLQVKTRYKWRAPPHTHQFVRPSSDKQPAVEGLEFVSRPPSSKVQLCAPPSSLSNTLGHLSGVEGHSPVARRTGHKPRQAVGNRMLFRKVDVLGRCVSLAPWTSHTVGRAVARRGALKRPSLAPHLRQH